MYNIYKVPETQLSLLKMCFLSENKKLLSAALWCWRKEDVEKHSKDNKDNKAHDAKPETHIFE